MWKLSIDYITSRQQEENVEVFRGGGEEIKNFSL